jgi:hypothetical protein
MKKKFFFYLCFSIRNRFWNRSPVSFVFDSVLDFGLFVWWWVFEVCVGVVIWERNLGFWECFSVFFCYSCNRPFCCDCPPFSYTNFAN